MRNVEAPGEKKNFFVSTSCFLPEFLFSLFVTSWTEKHQKCVEKSKRETLGLIIYDFSLKTTAALPSLRLEEILNASAAFC